MIKVVIFDFDGVLVDSNEAWLDLFNRASKVSGSDQTITYDEIKPHAGKSYIEFLKGTRPKLSRDNDALGVIYTNFINMAMEDDFINSFKMIRGLKDSLRRLGKRYRLAVSSGNNRVLLNRFIRMLGLSEYFDLLVSSDDVENGKPSPDMLIKVVEHFGIAPEEAVYVGDSGSDVVAAKRAKMKSIVVLTGALDRSEAVRLKPDFILDDVTCLQEVL